MLTEENQADLSHFLITRYNVPYSQGRRPEIHKNEAWLSKRRLMFETWCLPSVMSAAQSAKIQWLILCAEDSPRSVKELMERLHHDNPWIVPKFISGNTLALDEHIFETERLGIRVGKYIMSTRIDSDDMVLPDFFSTLQAAAHAELGSLKMKALPLLFNFPTGFQIRDRRLYLSFDPSNPFLSILEDRQSVLLSCYATDHPRMYQKVARVRQLRLRSPAWVQVLHDSNEGNRLSGIRMPALWKPALFSKLDAQTQMSSTDRNLPRLKSLLRDLRGIRNLLSACFFNRSAIFASFKAGPGAHTEL